MYLYSFETNKYYTYAIKNIKDVVFCRLRQNGNNIEVVRDYYENDMPVGAVSYTHLTLPTNREVWMSVAAGVLYKIEGVEEESEIEVLRKVTKGRRK